jgi:hypothetical protein
LDPTGLGCGNPQALAAVRSSSEAEERAAWRLTVLRITEGAATFRGHRTWYRVVGDLPAPDGEVPLITIHGGLGR